MSEKIDPLERFMRGLDGPVYQVKIAIDYEGLSQFIQQLSGEITELLSVPRELFESSRPDDADPAPRTPGNLE